MRERLLVRRLLVFSALGLLSACGGSSAANDDAGTNEPADSSTAGDAGASSCTVQSTCGPAQESCCTTLVVSGGTFDRTYASGDAGAVGESDPATISGFALDKYEVTVGRFRQFVSALSHGGLPSAGAGKHAHLNDGKGLANGDAVGQYETGWSTSYNANVALTDANLDCDPDYATWTSAPGTREDLPINCVNWYEAYAFCIWDGAFLPSEAEWEYAAAGGAQQREWPWGGADPGTANQFAIYGCNFPMSGECAGVDNIAPVGTAALGAGQWGQLDLAGNVAEWTLDLWTATYPDPCIDCADLTAGSVRVARGGTFAFAAPDMLPTYRGNDIPTLRDGHVGFRCARAP